MTLRSRGVRAPGRRRLAALACLLTAGILGSLPGAPPAAAAIPASAGPCVDGWREMPVPDKAFISTPFDVLTHDGSEAWILGGTNQGVLALRWNGSAWKRTATSTRGHRGLVGGAVLADKKVLAVGYYRPTTGEGEGSMRPMSGRVVGATWKGRLVPDPPGPRATLTDVAAQPNGSAWAVGTRLQNGKLRAYALRWTGSRWQAADPWAGTGSGLLAVKRSPAGKIWAVGWKESSPGRPRPYIVKRVGGSWKTVKPAALPGGAAVLTDLTFRAGNDGYAVGYLTPKGTDKSRAILQRWNGSSWSNVDLPWADDFSALPRSVSVAEDGQVWIAGTQPANDRREPRGFIAHLDGDGWEVSLLDVPSDVRSEVMAIAATDSGAVAAASVGASLLVLQSCGDAGPAVAADGRVASRQAVSRSQVRVGNMKARRQSAVIDLRHIEDGHAIPDDAAIDADAFSLAGEPAAAVTLASPVKADDFWVKDMAAASGLKQWTKTYDGFAADFDGNGYRDVFYSRHGTINPRLALNGPGGFSNAPTNAFGAVDRHGCDVGDIDRDGAKDILCAVGASRGKAMKRHELSLAPDKAQRELVLGALGISDPLGRGRFAAIFRLDSDPYPEVFIANAPDRDDGWPGYNRFYRNQGGTLVPAPGVGLDSSHGAECVEATDIDKDGDVDLAYCTQYGFAGRAPGLRLMRNENGKLKDRTVGQEIRQIGDIDVAFADVSGDGQRDLIQLSPTRLRVSKWTKAGYRQIYETRIAHAWALAAGDASGDGRADIYVVRGNDSANKADRLLVSRKGGKKFISVKIPQTTKGSADDVIALDYDRNGHTDFVVLNGRRKAGPVQLLASFPRGR
jgi:hypothetical protein